jgi:hypothetical protein
MFKVNKSVAGPKPAAQLLPRDDLTRPLEQHRKNLERLFLEPNPRATLAQFSGAEVSLENPEANEPRRRIGSLRGGGLHFEFSGKDRF